MLGAISIGLVATGPHHARADAAGWTAQVKAAEVDNCRKAGLERYVARQALANGLSRDEARRSFEARADYRAVLGIVLATCDCTLDRMAADMSHADFLANKAARTERALALAKGECAPPTGEQFRAAGYMQVRIDANEDVSAFCAERYPQLGPAIAENLAVWRNEWKAVITATSRYAIAAGEAAPARASVRVLESLSEEKQALSCRNFLEALEARSWRQWKTDRRFGILEEFAARIPAR